jgi:hypothetical protein
MDDILLNGIKVEDSKPIYHMEFTSDDDHIIVKIPRQIAYENLRRVTEMGEDGKIKRSATLVCSASAREGSELTISFPNVAAGKVVTIPCKPTLNLNVGLVWRNAETETMAVEQGV